MSQDIGRFLEAIKRTEGGQYNRQGVSENGVTPFGAYGMLKENWSAWSAAAGVADIDMFDPAAQDRVAGYWGQQLFRRYGSWDLAAAAWFAGQEQTDQAARSGATGVGFFKNEATQAFLQAFQQNFTEAEGAQPPPSARKFATAGAAPQGWLNPIAGDSEYSNSFRVPRENKWGIHGAIDVYSKRGTGIVSPVGGKVLASKSEADKGGNWVQIQGDDGLTYYFAHMNDAPLVRAGQRINAGTQLGAVGNSGSAKGTKPHLHFAAKKNGQPINPYTYLEGAKNSQNTFSPSGSGFELAGQPSQSQKLDSVLESVSTQVAGGERQDYRKLGLPEDPELGREQTLANEKADRGPM